MTDDRATLRSTFIKSAAVGLPLMLFTWIVLREFTYLSQPLVVCLGGIVLLLSLFPHRRALAARSGEEISFAPFALRAVLSAFAILGIYFALGEILGAHWK